MKNKFSLKRYMPHNNILLYISLIFFIFVILFPFFWILLTSITPQNKLSDMTLFYDFSQATFKSYVFLFTERPFLTYIINSAVVSVMTMTLCVSVSTLASYAIARLRFRGKKIILMTVLCASMFPQIAVLAPIYIFITGIGLKNTWFGLLIPYMAFGMPLSIWYLTTFFKSIPFELEEAAKIDGCTPLQTFIRVIAPLTVPGIFTTAILIFIQSWNEYLISSTINTSEAARTIPVGITMFRGEFSTPWVDISTAIITVTIPLAVLVLVLQKRIIAGLTAGAVKG